MSAEKKHIRNGMGAVRPYLFGRLDLLDFVKDVFGAVEVERNSVSGGFHVQARIGDSVVVMAAMDPPYPPQPRPRLMCMSTMSTPYTRAQLPQGPSRLQGRRTNLTKSATRRSRTLLETLGTSLHTRAET
jgi:hypothetical protein